MTLTMLSACVGADWQPMLDIVKPVMEEYAERHGYGMEWLLTPYHDERWAYPYQKTQWVRDYITEHPETDYFWILDADILLTNLHIPVTGFIDAEHDIFMCWDITDRPNCGSYIIRNSPQSLRWLDTILAIREEVTSEQHAVILLADTEPTKSITKRLEHSSINSIPYDLYDAIGPKEVEEGQWHPNYITLTCHLPGMTPQRRAEIFSQIQGGINR